MYRTKDGRWRGAVTLPDGRRKYLSGTDRRELARRVLKVQGEVDSGLPVSTNGHAPTLAEWMDHYLDNIAALKLRPATLDSYRSKVRTLIVPPLGRHRLDRLAPEHLERWQVELSSRGLSASSRLQAHRILSRALKVAMQRGAVARNVATLVDAPSADRHEVQPLTGDEARRLLTQAAQQRGGARWSVALALGLRQGEALGLAWHDVDLDRGTIRIRQALQRQRWRHGCPAPQACGTEAKCPQRHGGGLVIVPPKSRASRRVLSLPPPLVVQLRQHRVAQHEERLRAGTLWDDRGLGLVFATETGSPVDPGRDWKDWKALLKAAGVRDARLHDARHTAATLLLQQGVPARVAMEVLGHSQISLTLGTYSHVAPELQEEAAARMGRALWGDAQ